MQPNGVTCGPTCTQLYLSEHRPYPNMPQSRAMHQELARLRSSSAVRTLPNIASTIGSRVLPAVGVGFVGFQLGTAFRNSWIVVDNPVHNVPVPAHTEFIWKSKGAIIYPNGNSPDRFAPEDGFVGAWRDAQNGQHTMHTHIVHDAGAFPECTPVDFPAPEYADGYGGWFTTFQFPGTYTDNCGEGSLIDFVGFMGLQRHVSGTAANQITALTEDTLPADAEQSGAQLANQSAPSLSSVKTGVTNELGTLNYPNLNDWLAHEFDPNTPDPFLVAVPSCVGVSHNVCIQRLQDAGLGVITSTELGFEEAVPIPQAAPLQAIRTVPAAGTMVAIDDEVVIEHNPEDDDMPRLVPAPLPASESTSGEGETEAEYRTRMAGSPWFFDTASSPATDAQQLTDATSDPAFGPNAVSGSEPAPGTRAHKGDPIKPRLNSPTMPTVGGGGPGGCTPWATPSINFAPLSGLGLLTVFPFAVPFWVFDSLDAWVGTPQTPAWDFHFPFAGEGDNWHVDLAMFDPHMPAIRSILLAGSLIAMAWFFLSLAMGGVTQRQEADR